MTTALDDQESKLASLKGQLPKAFHDRYQRLIDITRLTIAPTIDGPSRQQIAEYVRVCYRYAATRRREQSD